MQKITEGTLIPVSLAMALFGGIFWLSVMYAQGQANAASIQKLETKQQSMEEKIVNQNERIIERLTRIEAQIKTK